MIEVSINRGIGISGQRVEIVERKGLGHPDYICDSIMEAISVAISKEYLREFGAVLHHNIDKGLLAAGEVRIDFQGGDVIRPMELTIGDRATFEAMGKRIPVTEIAIEAAKKWIKENLRFVRPEEHVTYRLVLAPGSIELSDIFKRRGEVLGANDTSAAVGYYPLSPTEMAVLSLERYLNSSAFKEMHPETGEDVKVMGLRNSRRLDLTVAMPMLSAYISSEGEYFQKKEELHSEMYRFTEKDSGNHFEDIEIHFNTLDEKGRGIGGIYLSLLGTSAEDADSGQVGRGNRVNGLISMNRPMGTEAAAGKNPVSHVGKIYNILSHRIAKEIYDKVQGIEEVYVLLLSRIGTPIDKPQVASIQITAEEGLSEEDAVRQSRAIMEDALSKIGSFCMELSQGRYPVC